MAGFREDVGEAVAGGAWLFLASLAVSLAGFVFWLVIAGVAGVSSVGVASVVVSSAAIASTLVSSGLGLAVSREVAVWGAPAVAAALALAAILGVPAALLAVILASGVGYASYRLLAALLALVAPLSIAAGMSLVGLERFRGYFLAALAGASAKLATGIPLALAGYGAVAALAGYTAYPIAALLASLALLAPSLPGSLRGWAARIPGLASLAASNYPFMLSNQLLSTLGVYVFAYIVRAPAPTGALYIALMIGLVLASIPGSLLGAALPIGARRGSDPYAETLRLGLAVASPLVALTAASPAWLLGLVNPGLRQGSEALRLAALSVAPASAVTAAIVRLNKDARRIPLAALGAGRLALLLALLPPLARAHGATGAAAAYLIANTLLLPAALHYLPGAARPVLLLWLAQLAPQPLALTGQPQPLPGLEALLATNLLVLATKTLTPGEARILAATVLRALKPGKGGESRGATLS